MKRNRFTLFFNKKRIIRVLMLAICDIVFFSLSSFLSLLIRFEFNIDNLVSDNYLNHILKLLPFTAFVAFVIFAFFKLYNSLWQYASVGELVNILSACFIVSSVQILIHFMLQLPLPRSFLPLQFFLLSFFLSFIRFSYRGVRHIKNYLEKQNLNNSSQSRIKKRTILIGAGTAGASTIIELNRSKYSKNHIVCILDDDKSKHGTHMYGIPVVGTISDIKDTVERFHAEEILIAIPTLSPQRKHEILEICNQTQCKLRTLPGIYQLVNGEVDIKQIRDIEIEDLLFRESLEFQSNKVANYYNDKCILVTGGGGSIGSELCRQIAKCKPRKLVIFDIYENNAYDIQQELLRKFKTELNIAVEIGSVRDRARLETLFDKHKPQIVFHAAAHKHVPLMETSPAEAIKNNVFGTYNTADMAEKYGVEKFILISTDKAVNPTNIMGASKRLCEMIIGSRTDSKTSFSAVRFGNVLGSNGSVIPLFKNQIAEGGPVTVTDKRIIRYFMTIPEASKLVMEAGAIAKKGELFVLDMGAPVRIYDLAVNMIKLSGFEPNVDIMIEEIGLRPGEKLYEELLIKTETLSKTENKMIFIEKDKPCTREQINRILSELKEAISDSEISHEYSNLKATVKRNVTTFRDPEELNKNAESTEEMLSIK